MSYDEVHEDDVETASFLNVPEVWVDEAHVSVDEPGLVERVSLTFPDTVNDYADAAQCAAPLGWLNSAALTLDRAEDSLTLSFSVDDPRGGFRITVRRFDDGTLVLTVPQPDEALLHRPLRKLTNGVYEIQ